jgi:methylthioribose-1-phosphate isomerase
VKVEGRAWRTIWEEGAGVGVIDQTLLPHRLEVRHLASLEEVAQAIRAMVVRGAPLIGVTAAYGVALAMRADASDAVLARAVEVLGATRPTAVNLRWALEKMAAALGPVAVAARAEVALATARGLAEDDVEVCRRIGAHGAALLGTVPRRGEVLQVLTHCNAGWLGCVDWGTALAALYQWVDAGHAVHVWVDETRPRNQGASLTAWELGAHGVSHTVIADNVGGHLMQHGMVDVCLVGADRVTRRGDVANKVGTYLKALAAQDNGVPFWVAAPRSSVDARLLDGVKEIEIEQRDGRELSHVTGRLPDGTLATVEVLPPGARAANYGFDVTPARLVTGLITEDGLFPATESGLARLLS